jgi:hypothetical protein
MVLVEIMRVNSPGPESMGGGGAAAAADGSTNGGAFVPSDSLWINRVTLPASGAEGAAGGAGVYGGSGAEENEGVAAGEYEGVGVGVYELRGSAGAAFAVSRPVSAAASEAKRLVALVEPVGDSTGVLLAPKSDGAGHLNSAGGAAGVGAGGVYCCTGGADTGAGGGAAAAGRGWKNCVKPPSTDAESEAPEENPFMRGAPGAGAGAGGRSGIALGGGAGARSAGFDSAALTKMRVNSPGADAPAGAGAGTGLGSKDGTGV